LPNTPVLFLDRSIGKRKVAAALRGAGMVVEVHDDHFPADARDEDWLQVVGEREWIVLTKDKHIRHRAVEREALREAKVRAFVLTAGNVNGDEMAEICLQALPNILRCAATNSPPFLATVTKGGFVSILSSWP
jgi:predicted nuclease of predicted toxin-antitoxin system